MISKHRKETPCLVLVQVPYIGTIERGAGSRSSSRTQYSIASNTLSCLFRLKERNKEEVSTGMVGTRASCVRPWWTREIV